MVVQLLLSSLQLSPRYRCGRSNFQEDVAVIMRVALFNVCAFVSVAVKIPRKMSMIIVAVVIYYLLSGSPATESPSIAFSTVDTELEDGPAPPSVDVGASTAFESIGPDPSHPGRGALSRFSTLEKKSVLRNPEASPSVRTTPLSDKKNLIPAERALGMLMKMRI